jgi:signal transduction histidine kinase
VIGLNLREKLVFTDGILVLCILFPVVFYASSTTQQMDVLRTSLTHAEAVNSAFLDLSEIKRRIETLLFRMQYSRDKGRAQDVIEASQDFRAIILKFRELETSDYLLEGFVERYSDAELKIIASYLEIAALELAGHSSQAWPVRNQLTLLEPAAVVQKTDLSSYLTNLIVDYTREMDSRRAGFLNLALVCLVLTLLIVALRYRFIRQSIIRPLLTLRLGLRRIREGRRTVKLQGTPESPEIDELIESFNRMSESLEQNRQYREIFSAITAHDLKEPLGAILSLVRMREMELDDKNDLETLVKDDRELLKRLELNATIGLNMIDGLLQLSRSSFQEVSYQDIEVTQVIERIFGELKGFYVNKRPELEVKDLGVIHGDLRQIETLFRNLFSNSIKFGKPEKEKVLISVWATHTEEEGIPYLNIHIRDDGVGFDVKEYERLVQPFETKPTSDSDRSEHHVMRGVGLGLAVCHRILRNHRGQFKATSQVGVGSEFILCFPTLAPSILKELRSTGNAQNLY